MRSLVVIFVVLVLGIIFIFIWDLSSKSTIEKNNYNEISWRTPSDRENQKFSESFLLDELEACTEYFIKKFEGEKYLIACNPGDGSWFYYTAYFKEKKVYRTPKDVALTLLPPENNEGQTDNFHASQDLKVRETEEYQSKSLEAR